MNKDGKLEADEKDFQRLVTEQLKMVRSAADEALKAPEGMRAQEMDWLKAQISHLTVVVGEMKKKNWKV